MKKIVLQNDIVKSDDHKFADYYVKFTNISVGKPCLNEAGNEKPIYPNQCRIRDITYAAPINVDVEYTLGSKQLNRIKGIEIGKMPIMLGSSNCLLSQMSHEDLAKQQECPYDPRGYFVIKGSEKVLLIQE